MAEPQTESSMQQGAARERVSSTLKRLSRTGALPTLPAVASAALGLVRDPDAGIDQLCRIIETDASIALVGNMGQVIPGVLGLRLPIEPDDGLLDLIAVGAHGPIHGLKGLADQLTRTTFGGEHGSHSVRLRGRRIIVETDRPAPMQVDGDYVGEGNLEAKVLPAALEVLVPA